MTWFAVDDRLHGHPKVDALARVAGAHWGDAIALWTMAGSWCAGFGTGGAISTDRLARVTPLPGEVVELATDALIAVGLWERTSDGIQFHDWDDSNFSVEQESMKRRKNAERQKAHRQRHAERVTGNVTRNVTESVTRNVTVTPPVPTRPDPSRPVSPTVIGEEREEARALPASPSAPHDDGQSAARRQAKLEQRARVESLARFALGYLNQRTGKRYDPMGDANLIVVGKLLAWYDKGGRGGAKQAHEDVARVVDAKIAEWAGDVEMVKFLRPETLFRLSKYQVYLADIEAGPGRGVDLRSPAGPLAPRHRGASVQPGTAEEFRALFPPLPEEEDTYAK